MLTRTILLALLALGFTAQAAERQDSPKHEAKPAAKAEKPKRAMDASDAETDLARKAFVAREEAAKVVRRVHKEHPKGFTTEECQTNPLAIESREAVDKSRAALLACLRDFFGNDKRLARAAKGNSEDEKKLDLLLQQCRGARDGEWKDVPANLETQTGQLYAKVYNVEWLTRLCGEARDR